MSICVLFVSQIGGLRDGSGAQTQQRWYCPLFPYVCMSSCRGTSVANAEERQRDYKSIAVEQEHSATHGEDDADAVQQT